MTFMSRKYQFLRKNHMVQKNLFKYFIGYNDNDVIRPLCIKLSQMTGYVRKYDGNTRLARLDL